MSQPTILNNGVEGWEGPATFSAAITGIPRPTNTDFFEEVKSTLPPLHPKGVKESPWTGW